MKTRPPAAGSGSNNSVSTNDNAINIPFSRFKNNLARRKNGFIHRSSKPKVEGFYG